MEDRIAKLPKWTQQYIHKLERDIKDLESQIKDISDKDSPISWSVFMSSSEYVGIPRRATVTFKTTNGPIEIALRDNSLRVTSSSGPIAVLPSSGNTLQIKCFDRF